MRRISISLNESELSALESLAAKDCRHPHEQMRYILREEAKRRGLLFVDANGISQCVMPAPDRIVTGEFPQ